MITVLVHVITFYSNAAWPVPSNPAPSLKVQIDVKHVFLVFIEMFYVF